MVQSVKNIEVTTGTRTHLAHILLDSEGNDCSLDSHVRVKVFFEVEKALSQFIDGPSVVLY